MSLDEEIIILLYKLQDQSLPDRGVFLQIRSQIISTISDNPIQAFFHHDTSTPHFFDTLTTSAFKFPHILLDGINSSRGDIIWAYSCIWRTLAETHEQIVRPFYEFEFFSKIINILHHIDNIFTTQCIVDPLILFPQLRYVVLNNGYFGKFQYDSIEYQNQLSQIQTISPQFYSYLLYQQHNNNSHLDNSLSTDDITFRHQTSLHIQFTKQIQLPYQPQHTLFSRWNIIPNLSPPPTLTSTSTPTPTPTPIPIPQQEPILEEIAKTKNPKTLIPNILTTDLSQPQLCTTINYSNITKFIDKIFLLSFIQLRIFNQLIFAECEELLPFILLAASQPENDENSSKTDPLLSATDLLLDLSTFEPYTFATIHRLVHFEDEMFTPRHNPNPHNDSDSDSDADEDDDNDEHLHFQNTKISKQLYPSFTDIVFSKHLYSFLQPLIRLLYTSPQRYQNILSLNFIPNVTYALELFEAGFMSSSLNLTPQTESQSQSQLQSDARMILSQLLEDFIEKAPTIPFPNIDLINTTIHAPTNFLINYNVKYNINEFDSIRSNQLFPFFTTLILSPKSSFLSLVSFTPRDISPETAFSRDHCEILKNLANLLIYLHPFYHSPTLSSTLIQTIQFYNSRPSHIPKRITKHSHSQSTPLSSSTEPPIDPLHFQQTILLSYQILQSLASQPWFTDLIPNLTYNAFNTSRPKSKVNVIPIIAIIAHYFNFLFDVIEYHSILSSKRDNITPSQSQSPPLPLFLFDSDIEYTSSILFQIDMEELKANLFKLLHQYFPLDRFGIYTPSVIDSTTPPTSLSHLVTTEILPVIHDIPALIKSTLHLHSTHVELDRKSPIDRFSSAFHKWYTDRLITTSSDGPQQISFLFPYSHGFPPDSIYPMIIDLIYYSSLVSQK